MREEHRQRMLENRVLRKIFGPKRGKVTGQHRRLHNEELHDLYSSPNIIWVVKSRRMRLGDLRERDHLKDLDIGGRIILKLISKKWNGDRAWNYLSQDGREAGACECSNELLGSMKYWGFLD
jgi:hypothetical protein